MGSSIASHGVLPEEPPQDVWAAPFSGWRVRGWSGLTRMHFGSVDTGA